MKNILLSDDDSEDCMFFSDVLDEIFVENNANLTIVSDGMALMETLEKTNQPHPEVIFLDINIPKKNGIECLQEIRSNPNFSTIPVIIFSTSANADIVDKTFAYGANYYICKPSTYPLLKKAIQTVLSFDHKTLSRSPSRESYII